MKYLLLALVCLYFISGLKAQVKFNITGGNVVQSGNFLVLDNASLLNSGTFTANGGTVSFQGNGADGLSIIGGTSVTTFNILQVNKSANNVLLGQNVNVSSDLSFSSGLLDVLTYNLTLQTGASIAGAGTNTYVKTSSTGFLIFDFPGIGIDIAFPVGNSAYNPLTINNVGTDDAFGVRVRDEVLDSGTTGNALTENFVDRTWMVEERTSGGANVTMTAQWNEDEELTGFNRDVSYISSYSSGWSFDNFQMASGANPYAISRSGISDFSEFTVSSDILCPTITALTEISDICAGSTFDLSATGLANMSASLNFTTNYGIRFVAFSGTTPPADPYTGGIDLGNIVSNGELIGADPNQSASVFGVGSNLAAGDYLIYAVLSLAPNEEDCKVSQFIGLTIEEATTITGQPSGLTFCIGDDHTFSVTATGTSLTYQWKKNGTNIDGATSAILNLTDLQVSDAGSYTCEVNNLCGTVSSNAAILVIESTAPVLSNCPSYSNPISTDAGQCYATINFTAPTASDNCMVAAVEAQIMDDQNNVVTAHTTNPDGQFAAGIYSIIWRATDSAGNNSSCSSASFTVEDDEKPNAVCETSFTAILSGNTATISTNDIDAGSTDNCMIASLNLSETNFNCSDIGTFEVTLTVTDDSNNSSTCTTSLTIEDNTAPSAVCSDFAVQLDVNGSGSITASDIDEGSSDVCGIASLAIDNKNFNCTNIGSSNTVTLTVTDVNGNTSNCTATVTVVDNNTPTAQCLSAVDFELASDGTTVLTSDVIDNGSFNTCGSFTLSLSQTDFDCDDVNESFTVILTITDDDNNLSSDCQTTVNVIDPNLFCCLPPAVVCNDLTVQLDAMGMVSTTASAVGAGSFANCGLQSETITQDNFTCADVGVVTVTYTMTDINNESASCTSNIQVVIGDDLPDGWSANNIGIVTIGNEYSFDPCTDPNPENGEFTITGSGNNATSFTTDNVAFAAQTLCGDGSITAKIESVTPNGYGGLMIRETNDAEAKQVSIFSNLSSLLRHEVRYTTNGVKQINNFFKPSPFWLRLERQGDWVFAYYSTTGGNFTYIHAVFVPMQECVEIGLASFTYLPSAQTEAVFSNVNITGTIQTGSQANPEAPENVQDQIKEVQIFPNPTARGFTVRFSTTLEQETTLQLRNELGQLIEEKVMEQGRKEILWDATRVHPGSYWLTIDKENLFQKVWPVIIIR